MRTARKPDSESLAETWPVFPTRIGPAGQIRANPRRKCALPTLDSATPSPPWAARASACVDHQLTSRRSGHS
ncbi:Hypothetical protein A7982_10508 [Minicystis rosea]|nr:Hypothetical protein A7982_10508 [Minicystis rosea]